LRKLELGREVSNDERAAMRNVAEELRLLAEAGQIPLKEKSLTVPSHLQRSFCTLVALQEKAFQPSRPPRFGKAGQDLNEIQQMLESGGPKKISQEVISRARLVCLELLENLNEQRPNTASM
jgi:hypothetical protein